MTVKIIDYKVAIDFLLPRHYSGRKPQVKWAFGWYDNDELIAVCTFGKPASPSLCRGVCGEKYSQNVYELNRLCRLDRSAPPPIRICFEVSTLVKKRKPYYCIV